MANSKVKKTCEYGHTFFKSSDCPTCPSCEKLNKPFNGFLALLSSPARNALLHAGIDTIQKLAQYSDKEILALHGVGKTTIPILKKALEANRLDFKTNVKSMLNVQNNPTVSQDILDYNNKQSIEDKAICEVLSSLISQHLPTAENKLWHGHPVWFLDGNPITGYSKEKKGLRLMFWSGADFDEKDLNVIGKKFKDASIFYQSVKDINTKTLIRWLKLSKEIQWDYKNIVKRKGVLVKIK